MRCARKQETYVTYVEIESIGSREHEPDTYYLKRDFDEPEQDDLRRPLVAALKPAPGGGLGVREFGFTRLRFRRNFMERTGMNIGLGARSAGSSPHFYGTKFQTNKSAYGLGAPFGSRTELVYLVEPIYSPLMEGPFDMLSRAIWGLWHVG